MTSERQTRSHLMGLFKAFGWHPRADFGQNFLVDVNLIEFVVRSAELSPRDVVLEVGPGTGGMTTFLAAQAGAVVSVEIDPRMFALARVATEKCENVTLLNQDALRSKHQIAPEVLEAVASRRSEIAESRLKLVANLPYSVATPVISNLVASEVDWERIVVTIQWELAERMTAAPGTSEYGALSVWLQSQCGIQVLRKLPPSVFWPRPKVDSAIVSISPDASRRVAINDRAFFHEFVRGVFSQRRKRLRGTLAGMYRNELTKPAVDAILSEAGCCEDQRAETMGADALVRLSNRLRQAILIPAAQPQHHSS